MFINKVVGLKLSQNSQENNSARVSFLIKLRAEGLQFCKKETPIEVLSCEICEISKNTHFVEHLLMTKENGPIWEIYWWYPTNIYLFKVNNRNTRKMCEIYSKLTIKTPERRRVRRSCVSVVNFEQILHIFLVFLLLTLNR